MIRLLIYPTVLAGSLVAAWLSLEAGGSGAASTFAVVVAAALVIWVAERRMPFRRSWRRSWRSLRVDAVHALVSISVVNPLVKIGMIAAVAWLATDGPLGFAASSAWLQRAPLLVEVVAAIAIADLGAYVAHRAMHRFEIGWRVHAVHHSPSALDWLAAARAHPLNAMLTLSAESAPLLLLGIRPEAFVLATVFKAVNGMLQHSNVEMRCGWLSRLVATSDCHRWHHSRDAVESSTNFGNTTMIWDHLFGTFSLPAREAPPVGIGGVEIPETYVDHLLTPLRYGRHREPRLRPTDRFSS